MKKIICCGLLMWLTMFEIMAQKDTLPEPFATPAVRNPSKVIGWPEGKKPVAPVGFEVNKYAGDMKNPRWIYELPNHDVLVACANTGAGSANIILLFRGMDKNGQATERDTFLSDLNRPFGM